MLVNLVSDNKDISPKISNLFASCVDYAYEHLSEEDRYLSRAFDLVPIDFSLQASLDRWINTGCFASLFDNKAEDLDFNNNLITINENVEYNGIQGTIIADNVKIDLITKKIEIYMDYLYKVKNGNPLYINALFVHKRRCLHFASKKCI